MLDAIRGFLAYGDDPRQLPMSLRTLEEPSDEDRVRGLPIDDDLVRLPALQGIADVVRGPASHGADVLPVPVPIPHEDRIRVRPIDDGPIGRAPAQ